MRWFSSGGATSSAICSAVSADWRCGRTTWPIGWIVAARRSTRTVRSLAATGSMVTTAQRAATPAGSDAGSPQNTTDRARSGSAAASARSAGVVRVLAHEDRLGPGPGSDCGACGAPQRRCRLSEEGQHIARLEGDEPGSLGVVADGKHDGKVREGEVVTLEGSVADVPRAAVLGTHEAGGRLSAWRAGETEGDAGVRDADGPDRRADGSALQGQAQQTIGGLERMRAPEHRGSGAARSPCPGRPPTAPVPRTGSSLNRTPVRRRDPARRAKAAQASEPSPRASNSGRWPSGPGRDARLLAPTRAAPSSAGGAGIRGEPEAPSLPEPIRIDEARPVADVAAEIERGERRPIRPVAQEIVRDAPQRVARLHRIARGRDSRRRRGGARPGVPR